MSDVLPPFSKRAADAMADAVASLIERGVISSRSPAGDALLDYRDPPQGERRSQKMLDALLLLVEAKRLHDSMEAYPNVCGGALNEATYKDLKRRGWDLAFQIVDQHKKDMGS